MQWLMLSNHIDFTAKIIEFSLVGFRVKLPCAKYPWATPDQATHSTPMRNVMFGDNYLVMFDEYLCM